MHREGRGAHRRVAIRLVPAALLVVAGALATPSARGAAIPCGTTITSDMRLKQDIGPCSGDGLIVTANNVRIDLNGHRIFGTGLPGDGIGVRIVGAQGVKLQNGTITNFDAGVLISQGSQNIVRNIKAIANIGAAGTTDFGDGILISSSAANIVKKNEIRSNGPFSGISVIGNSVGNKLAKNIVQDNDIASNDTENNDVGIRLEDGTTATTLKRNVVSFSGLDGVAIFSGSTSNVLLENTLKFNGFHDESHRKGDGIRVFGSPGPDNNTLKKNNAQENAGNGIILSVGASSNALQKNRAKRNGFGQAGSFDLVDQNDNCDQNTWFANTFGSRSQGCIL